MSLESASIVKFSIGVSGSINCLIHTIIFRDISLYALFKLFSYQGIYHEIEDGYNTKELLVK